MAVYLLNPDDQLFPHASLADPSGLLAVGGDLSEGRLLNAYCNGIFPWFEEDGDFYWYSPDPRVVLFPKELIIHKSMRSVFNQHKFRYSLDTCFTDVMMACASTPRPTQDGTWITDRFVEGYSNLNRQGIAHSIEVWSEDRLVGGLYGLSVGKMFFGESMFALENNASKAGFITLVRALEKSNFWLVDCQVGTPHLESLGARGISRDKYLELLGQNTYNRTLMGKWRLNELGMIEVE